MRLSNEVFPLGLTGCTQEHLLERRAVPLIWWTDTSEFFDKVASPVLRLRVPEIKKWNAGISLPLNGKGSSSELSECVPCVDSVSRRDRELEPDKCVKDL